MNPQALPCNRRMHTYTYVYRVYIRIYMIHTNVYNDTHLRVMHLHYNIKYINKKTTDNDVFTTVLYYS